MSTIIMSQCWPLQMPLVAKSVLLSLADNANDHGACWPSLETIAERTCASRRAVIDAVKWLEASGILSADRTNGRHTRYLLQPAAFKPAAKIETKKAKPVQEPHPCTSRTRAPAAPTSAPAALVPVQEPHQPVQEPHTNRKEPSVEPSKNRKTPRADALGMLLGAGVQQSTAEDFLRVRAAKKLPLTQTAWDGLMREAESLGMSAEAAVAMCCIRGWATLRAEWLDRDGGRAGQRQAQPQETAYARKMRETYEKIAPSIAAKRPGAPEPRGQVIDITPRPETTAEAVARKLGMVR